MINIAPLLSENVKKHFLTLPASHQKEWVNYINEAKKEETRLKRVLKMQMSFCEKYTLEGELQVINLLEQIININSQEGNALLDGILLNTQKEVSQANRQALAYTKSKGVKIKACAMAKCFRPCWA